MVNDLTSPADLADFPGAPFTDTMVDVAVDDLRGWLGWHVSPVRTETLLLDHDGGGTVILPSRKVATVNAVRDVSGTTPVELTDWRLSPKGFLTAHWWPTGTAVLEVDLTHGHTEPSPSLLRAVAARAVEQRSDARASSVSIDDFSLSLEGNLEQVGALSQVWASYGLPREFG